MSVFEFTLVLDRALSDGEEDTLGEQVPVVGAVEGGNGMASLVHVDVEADDFASAVLDAVRQVERLGHRVVGLQVDDLVDVKEIAARTGRSYESVRLLAAGKRGQGGFPAAISPQPWGLYSWTAVAGWFGEHYPGQRFELDRQAVVADHLLRARHMAGAGHGDDWVGLLTA